LTSTVHTVHALELLLIQDHFLYDLQLINSGENLFSTFPPQKSKEIYQEEAIPLDKKISLNFSWGRSAESACPTNLFLLVTKYH